MGEPTPTAALLLPPSARVRFRPNADFNGEVQLFYHAWDQTAGVAGGTLPAKGNPASASVGNEWDGAALTVLPVNDDPVLAVGGAVGYVHNAPPIQLAPAASVTDIDSADFDGGRLKVEITTANVTPFMTQQLVRAITFKTVGGSAGPRQVVFSVKDGDGGLSANAVKTVNVS
jgi:hypothetical protein